MIKYLKIILLIAFASAYTLSTAQVSYTKQDSLAYARYVKEFSKYKDKPINELVALTGKYFLGNPYTTSTLEGQAEERLVINLREFDCTTFVETVIALSKELKKDDAQSFEGFMDNVQWMRYRDGKIKGYTTRIHYSSDWVYENTQIFDNITVKLGGAIVSKPVNFMSSNAHLYPTLKNSRVNQEKIKGYEQIINKRNNYALLPISKIKSAEKDIKTGDIIIFGTSVHGLDYSHIGFAIWEGGVLKLLHASSARKRIVIDTKPLVQYCTSSKTCTGITILRLTNN